MIYKQAFSPSRKLIRSSAGPLSLRRLKSKRPIMERKRASDAKKSSQDSSNSLSPSSLTARGNKANLPRRDLFSPGLTHRPWGRCLTSRDFAVPTRASSGRYPTVRFCELAKSFKTHGLFFGLFGVLLGLFLSRSHSFSLARSLLLFWPSSLSITNSECVRIFARARPKKLISSFRSNLKLQMPYFTPFLGTVRYVRIGMHDNDWCSITIGRSLLFGFKTFSAALPSLSSLS